MCGLASIDAVRTASAFPILPVGFTVSEALIAALPDRLRASQDLFDATGGVHAAGLFDAAGEPLVMREDVGRHNAVDKVVGHALTEGLLPLSRTVLQVSGRASFELVQKARMAGIPVLAAVSAPSSLAVELAEDAGITLVGFSRGPLVHDLRPPGADHGLTCAGGVSACRVRVNQRSETSSTRNAIDERDQPGEQRAADRDVREEQLQHHQDHSEHEGDHQPADHRCSSRRGCVTVARRRSDRMQARAPSAGMVCGPDQEFQCPPCSVSPSCCSRAACCTPGSRCSRSPR